MYFLSIIYDRQHSGQKCFKNLIDSAKLSRYNENEHVEVRYLKMGSQVVFDKENCSSYDKAGKPKDTGYLECGLPDFLQESIQIMKAAWDKLDSGAEYFHWDCDYCSLQSDINSAEVNQLISSEQAWFLREKYLRLERV